MISHITQVTSIINFVTCLELLTRDGYEVLVWHRCPFLVAKGRQCQTNEVYGAVLCHCSSSMKSYVVCALSKLKLSKLYILLITLIVLSDP